MLAAAGVAAVSIGAYLSGLGLDKFRVKMAAAALPPAHIRRSPPEHVDVTNKLDAGE